MLAPVTDFLCVELSSFISEHFHNFQNYWQKYPHFGIFAPQKLRNVLVIGTLSGGTKLAPTNLLQ